MDFICEYGLFLFKIVTVFICFIIIFLFFSYCAQKKTKTEGILKITNIIDHYNNMKHIIISSKNNKYQKKTWFKKKNTQYLKHKNSNFESLKPTLYIIDFYGDIHASEVSSLREEISAIISVSKQHDEVLLRLESAGGTIHEYGLAASQLQRLREKNIKLIISIDKIAASGGYMMACIGNHISASYFSIIGSIGVVSLIPNFYKLLKKHNIDIELHTAGDYKRTLTLFGKNTENDRQYFKNKLNNTHDLFKNFIYKMRPCLNLNEISNGDYWFGITALEKKLIDSISTSDDLILEKIKDFNIFHIQYIKPKKIFNRFLHYFVKKIKHYLSIK
ncbi:Probable protease SohB [Buchnera aphidicola (Phyllaphis fagi)]|uniref:protease SohB n=1 Tax=Buchnera aphidicola TaxID=9 RepID=UPI00346431B8